MQKMFTWDQQELKNKQTEVNNTRERIHSRIAQAEARINDLEDRMVEATATEQDIEKKWSEDSLRGPWDNVKHTHIHVIGSQKGNRERKDLRKYPKR